MAKTSPAQQKAVHKYVKNNYDRLELSVPKGEKEKIKKAAIAAGQSVNNYIYIAVCHKMEQDTPAGELKITDTPSNQDKALSCSISPAQKKASAGRSSVLNHSGHAARSTRCPQS